MRKSKLHHQPHSSPPPLTALSFPTAFVRKDALPLGTFSKYTWHITNILQVKQIFDTPEVRGNHNPTLLCLPLPSPSPRCFPAAASGNHTKLHPEPGRHL